MNEDAEMLTDRSNPDTTPSVDFIHAISDFFETDPDDLLVELGYYRRSNPETSEAI